tara:strand:+ start:23128 stop:24030 length:903 start_codon:yes stop_codon:yes gene_type:complete
MKKLFLYLNFVRWKNLLLLFFSQLLFKYQVFPYFNAASFLNTWEFLLLMTSLLCIASGGYIINDLFDIKCDKINKPKKAYIPNLISVKSAKILYIISTGIGFFSGTTVCLLTDKPIHIVTCISVIFILYLYSVMLKKIAFLGNLITSALVSFNLILLLLLDSDIHQINEGVHLTLLFSFFALFINLLREIIKDIEDINGDYNAKLQTLPIVIGADRTVKFILALSLIPLYFLISFGTHELEKRAAVQLFYWICIVLLFLFFIYKTYTAKSKDDFSFISKLLKLLLTFGLVLIFLITYTYA